MLKINSIQFVYDQENNVTGYRVTFDGENPTVQMLSGSLELKIEDVDLSQISAIVQRKLSDTLGK